MASTLKRIEVEICPNNENEFWNASKRLGCLVDDNGRSRYLCLPNSSKSKLLEFCYSQRIGPFREAGYCPQILDTNQLNGETCAKFTYGCPNITYDLQKLYQHPACLKIDMMRKCYLADPECFYTKSLHENDQDGHYHFSTYPNTTISNDIQPTAGNSEFRTATIILCVFLVFMIVLMLLAGFVIRRLWKKRRKGKGDTEQGNGDDVQTDDIPLMKDVGTQSSQPDGGRRNSLRDEIHGPPPDSGRHGSPAVTDRNNSPLDDFMHDSTPHDGMDDSPSDGVIHESSPDGVGYDSPADGGRQDSPPGSVRHDSTPDGGRHDSTPGSRRQHSPPDSGREDSPPDGVRQDSAPDNDQQTFEQSTIIDEDTVFKTAINMLLYKDINDNLEEKDIEYLRDFTGDTGILSEEERTKPRKDFLRCLAKRIDLKKNLYYLQALLHRIGKPELANECAKVAEALPITIYLERHKTPPENGFIDVTFHFNCKGMLRKEEIKIIADSLLQMLKIPVIYRGGEETNSFLLTFMIPEDKVTLMKKEIKKAGHKFLALGVDYFLVDGKKIKITSEEIQNIEVMCVSQINGDTTLEVSFDPPTAEVQSVTWQKMEGTTTVSIDTDVDKYNVASPESTSLTIKSFGQADTGTYICTVKSVLGLREHKKTICIDETFLFPQEVQLALCSLLLKNKVKTDEVDFSSFRNIQFFSHLQISEVKKNILQSVKSCKELEKYALLFEGVLLFTSEKSKNNVFISFCRRRGFVDFILNQDVAHFKMFCSPNYNPKGKEPYWNINMQQLEIMTQRMGMDILRHPTIKDKTIHDKVANILNIPKEILEWGGDKIKVFIEHLKNGETRIYHAIGMIVGCASAGKTTLLKKIKGEKDLRVESTRGVDTVNDFEIEGTDLKEISRRKNHRFIKVRHSDLPEGKYQTGEKRKETNVKNYHSKSVPDPELQNKSGSKSERHNTEIYQPTNDMVSDESHLPKPTMNVNRKEDTDLHTSELSKNESLSKQDSFAMSESKKAPKKDDNKIFPNEISKEENISVSSNKEASQTKINIDKSNILSQHPKVTKDFTSYVSLYTNKEMKTISFLDFAGQCTYYASHQVYLSPRSFYILVVNMSKSLDEKVGKEECDFPGSYYEDWTYKDFIIYWMESIHAYSDADSRTDTTHTSSKTNCPVILVLTHMDKIESEADIEEETRIYFNAIMEALPEKVKSHIDKSRVFATSIKSNHNIQELKKCVVDLAQTLENWGRRVPCAWIDIESELLKLKSQKIFKTEMLWEKICSNTSFEEFKKEEDLKIPLKFFHETGKILYFNEPLLEKWIILDIQWFVDSFKNIITIKSHAEKDLLDPALKKWITFRENGELTTELLTEIWENLKEDYLSYKEEILLYMKRLRFITELESNSEEGSKCTFYVPCMNSRKVERDLLPVGKSSSVLGFRFEFLPSGLYHRLVAACINNPSWDIWMKQSKRCLFENVSIFSHKKVEGYTIYVGLNKMKIGQKDKKLHQYAIEVQVVAEGSQIRKSVCREVGRTLIYELKSTANTLHANVTFEIVYGLRQTTDCPQDIPVTYYIQLSDDNFEKFHNLVSFWEKLKKEDKDIFDCSDDEYQRVSLYEQIRKGYLAAVQHLVENVYEGYDLSRPIFVAIESGRVELVRYFIKMGVEVNISTVSGYTPLHLSIDLQLPDMIDLFLKRKDVDINTQNIDHDTPLHSAVQKNMYDVTKRLVNLGSNINIQGSDGKTPLHLAVEKDYIHIVDYLIKHGANVNHLDYGKMSPIFFANSHEVVHLLVNAGAALNLINVKGKTPLCSAIAEQKPFDIVEDLCAYGADVNIRDEFFQSPLMHAIVQRRNRLTRTLISYGSNLNTVDDCGNTVLLIATQIENYFAMELLLRKGADPNKTNRDNETPLSRAIENNSYESVKLLIRYGAYIHARDTRGKTPLHKAVVVGSLPTVKYLVRQGAKVNAVDFHGFTPIQYAIERQHFDISSYLAKNTEAY